MLKRKLFGAGTVYLLVATQPWMLTIIQQLGYCCSVFYRCASFTGNFHDCIAHKSPVSPPTSAFVTILCLNVILLLTWALCRHRGSWALTGTGRQKSHNLLKWSVRGEGQTQVMIPFEWISGKHSTESPKGGKKAYEFLLSIFSPFILEKHNVCLEVLSQMAYELGISQAFLFKELLLLFSSKSALLQ